MNMKRRTSLIASLVCGALLVAAATVGATTIAGTAGNDTLRGGAKADKLNGKGGNDKLYGLAGNDVLTGGPGNDLLVGGPGADRHVCGAGRDTVRGDAQDKAAKDCEVVRGISAANPAGSPGAARHRPRRLRHRRHFRASTAGTRCKARLSASPRMPMRQASPS